MPAPSKGTPVSRAFGRVGPHLSFANVTALVALFVALGGSSYAAMRVGSQEIVDNSVASKDLRNNDVRGQDILKDTVRGTDVRDGDLTGKDVRDDTVSGADVKESGLGIVPAARDAETLAGKSADAFLGSDRQMRTGLIKLAHGDSRTIASSGPFTWKAACSDVGAGITRLMVTVETTEANSFAGDFGSGGQPVSPGSPVTLLDQSQAGALYTIGFPLSAVAPSGAAPAGLAFAGIGVLGTDCVINGVLWP
jgi:hypothetical protein